MASASGLEIGELRTLSVVVGAQVVGSKDGEEVFSEQTSETVKGEELAKLLRKDAGCRVVEIDGVDIDASTDAFLASFFNSLAGRSLDEVSVSLPDSGLAAVCEAVKRHGDVATFQVRSDAKDVASPGLVGMRAVAELLAAKSPLLTSLRIRDNLSSDTARILGDALRSNNTLHSLDLRNSGLGAEAIKAIAEGLRANDSIRSVDLFGNSIGLGAEKLAQALLTNTRMESITLSSCEIGDEGLVHISRALLRNTSLRTLLLRNNGFTASGMNELAVCLAENGTLSLLDLGDNKIGDEGAESLSQGLVGNFALKKLVVRKTDIGDDGVEALAVVLPNTGIEVLDLRANKVGDQGAAALATMLPENEVLMRLELADNNLGESGLSALTEAQMFCTAEISLQ
jgi:Ran GTPase-activating protein (RanGAP) involved in mRNA processing and transport